MANTKTQLYILLSFELQWYLMDKSTSLKIEYLFFDSEFSHSLYILWIIEFINCSLYHEQLCLLNYFSLCLGDFVANKKLNELNNTLTAYKN